MNSDEHVQLIMYDFQQCDPKRCSGQRLAKQNLIKCIPKSAPFTGILLSSEGKSVLSRADLPLARQRGLGVVDCSWNEILEHDSVPIQKLKAKNHRLLPFLIAANPVNYGKPLHLNCAEAVVAGLYVMGLKSQAGEIAEKVGYGDQFIKLNWEYLEGYAECMNAEDVEAKQKEYLEKLGDKAEVEENHVEELEEEEEVDYNAIWAKIDKEKENEQ